MSLQILQKPQRPVAEETITVEPRFERVENQPEREVSRQFAAAWIPVLLLRSWNQRFSLAHIIRFRMSKSGVTMQESLSTASAPATI